ncbi:MAG: D-glucuronyl C5-epimerase family protein [Dictyoglomus thermophilum]|nr:D-glucuronyl C5-epimerase family protein [Dictyoglomus thermophilum]MCX7720178.1 D-glucuronyl C5-epimerase family protein [Dictyoglomus thermophilum]
MKGFIVVGFIVWFFLVSLIFNKFAYEINQFNAKFRNLLIHKKFNIIEFDENGFPYNFSPKYRDKFISPFYVVHYGIVYSEFYKKRYDYHNLHWNFEETLELWDKKAMKTEKDFIPLCDWIVQNIKKINGKFHLIYDFDWIYKGYPNNLIRAPWYSGLTDAYSLILLLRAYDITKDVKYLEAADKLYISSISPISEGGSLNFLDGKPWIEEYVDPRIDDYKKLPYVLNGMIYATYGIMAYEKFRNVKNGYSLKLLESIFYNLEKFYNNGWSYYDLIKTSANLKYHRIHRGLLAELIGLVREGYFEIDRNLLDKAEKILVAWNKSCDNLGLYYILYGERSFTYWHFLASYIFVLLSYWPLGLKLVL